MPPMLRSQGGARRYCGSTFLASAKHARGQMILPVMASGGEHGGGVPSSKRTDEAGRAAGDELIHRAERVDRHAREDGVHEILQEHHLRACMGQGLSRKPWRHGLGYMSQEAQQVMVRAPHTGILDGRHDWCYHTTMTRTISGCLRKTSRGWIRKRMRTLGNARSNGASSVLLTLSVATNSGRSEPRVCNQHATRDTLCHEVL